MDLCKRKGKCETTFNIVTDVKGQTQQDFARYVEKQGAGNKGFKKDREKKKEKKTKGKRGG